ncbi:reverse transcriptase domain-containing protein [Tanacetum coccineum]
MDGETIEEFMERFKIETSPKDRRGCSKFTPLTRTPKEIFAAESGKFKPPPPMVTPIEELVRAGKLSHFIKEIRQDKDQQKTGKKDAPAKDKSPTIYMIQPWKIVTRQKVTQSFDRVREIMFPPLTVSKGTEDPLVIEAEIGGHAVHRMYVDGGSSMEWRNYMAARIAKALGDYRRRIALYESMDELYDSKVAVTVQWYHWTAGDKRDPSETPKDTEKKAETRHENFKVAIHLDFPDQEIAIGGALSAKGRIELCALLKANLDIFAWQPSDMTGVPRSIAEDRLNIRDGYPPVRQKKRGQASERAKAIQAEVQKLMEAGIMREVYYHDWLSNPVMVKKHDGSWRMYVDFTDLNKACPQDCYPLPEIDWKVESLCGYPFKCFLDAYKGYHQIQMAEADEEKTTFHTPQGVYCYTKMPFGLKNARATATYVGSTKTKGGTNNVLVCLPRSSWCSLDDKERYDPEPVYFLSRAFQGAELNYTPMENLILALWSIMLGEHNITCRPRTSVKGQILADFLVEKPDEVPANTLAKEVLQESWTLFTDGSSCVDGSGVGLILTKYEALIAGLRIAAQMGVRNVQVSVDSKLVANQVLGTYIAKEDNMIKYLEKTKSLVGGFDSFSISQVPRSKNKKAYALSKIASNSFAHLSKQVLVEILKEKSIQEKEVAAVVEEKGPTWMTPILEYLKDGTLPDDRKKASKLRIKARQYELWKGILYRRSFLKP